jgi:hypothetical protein
MIALLDVMLRQRVSFALVVRLRWLQIVASLDLSQSFDSMFLRFASWHGS